MVAAKDFLQLTYNADLVQGGIDYACATASHGYSRVTAASYERLRRTAAAGLVELAFRRALAERGIPFEVIRPVPFGEPYRYFASLAGRRCNIRTFLIGNRRQCTAIQHDPGLLLSAAAAIPRDEYAAEGQSVDDVYVFAFVLGRASVAARPEAEARNHVGPTSFVHLTPRIWSQPQPWIPMRPLSLKGEGSETLSIDVGGLGRDQQRLVRSVTLEPHRRVELDEDFHALTYVRARRRPVGRVGIHSASGQGPLIIQPGDWQDMWINGKDIYLTGWLTRGQFRQRATILRKGSQVLQFGRTPNDSLSVAVSELKPLDRLLELSRHAVR